ncbi:hypothetical protein Q5H93_17115 [Hymenobacter sp. ASUV-10]|uniref:HEAT repeat domain-containing protein n=1 Tax=Hymenobacter aranciens TaxID=3063996 RepID=A0ABT9BDX2_9BACT|nr:hypothetical protein [Hymenobacter sp. ASUV-10]MDO7876468.1 hypothetical protein [Hymenobacter sp. ASUV-10]
MRNFILGLLCLTCWGFYSPACWAQVRPAIQKLARAIAADSTVDAERVGRGGVETEQYRRYKQLLALATDAELLTLTDHRSPAVRCYAYQSLCQRNSLSVLSTLRKHECDTTMIKARVGCFGLYMPVIVSMKQDFEAWQKKQPQPLAAADTLLLSRIDQADYERRKAT